MKSENILLAVFIGCLIGSSVFAGTDMVMERRQVIREREIEPIPYGQRGIWPFCDDEVKSPYSEYTIESDHLVAGQVLRDPVVDMPFMVPDDD